MIKIRQKIHTIVYSLIICLSSVHAQDLTIFCENNELLDTLGSEVIFEIQLINNSSNELNVTIVRTEKSLPDTWSSSLCFENCFAPFIDSISTSADFGSSPLSPGENRIMSLHVFPIFEEGNAQIDLKFVNEGNPSEVYNLELILQTTLSSVNIDENKLDFRLSQNYPNPFNPTTTIEYIIPFNSNGLVSNVSLKVFDILGREIATLVNNTQKSGNYSTKFNADRAIPSGVYFYELRTEKFHQVKKMILEK